MTPLQRSKEYLIKNGYIVDKCEYWNGFAKKRKDLFDIFDLIAIHPKKAGVMGVQVTTRSNMSARIKKIKGAGVYPVWLGCKNIIQVHGWYKLVGKWVVKIIDL